MGVIDMLQNGMPSKNISPEEARKKDLEEKFSVVEGVKGRLDSTIEQEKGKVKKRKIQKLQELFSALREMGVDPANRSSIAGFIKKIEEINPELVPMFMKALDTLDPESKMTGRKSVIPKGVPVPSPSGSPMPGGAAPMPGGAAPMPGGAAPMPGGAAPMPGGAPNMTPTMKPVATKPDVAPVPPSPSGPPVNL